MCIRDRYDSAAEPSIFGGSLGEGIVRTFAQIGKRFAFGGEAPQEMCIRDRWESYLGFCQASASDFFTNTVKAAGLDSPFEEGTIGKIAQGLREIYNKM